jgi:predicted dehydrogenase
MKTALIGYGYWGKTIRKYIDDNSHFDLVSIFDINMVDDLLYTNNLDNIINDINIEVVFITTPVSTHYELCLKMLKSYKHVFCEKPAVLNLHEFIELKNIAEQNKKIFFTDYTYIYSEGIKNIKSLLHEIGPINFYTSTISQYGIFYKGLCAYEIVGVHMISILFFLLQFDILAAKLEYNHTDYFNVIKLELTNNVSGIINVNMLSSEKTRKFTIYGQLGQIEYNMLNTPNIILTKYSKGLDVSNVIDQIKLCTDESNTLNHSLNAFSKTILEKDNNQNLFVSQKVQEVLERMKKVKQ